MAIEVPIVFVREAIGDVVNSTNNIAKQLENLSFNNQAQQRLPRLQGRPLFLPSASGGFGSAFAQGALLLGSALSRRPLRNRIPSMGLVRPYSRPVRGPGPLLPMASPASSANAGRFRNISTAEFPSKRSAQDFFRRGKYQSQVDRAAAQRGPSRSESDAIDRMMREADNLEDDWAEQSLQQTFRKEVFKPENTQ